MTQNMSSKTCTKIDSFNEDYAFLSNFYPVTIEGISNDNLSYATVEHYYQAMKTIDKYARKLVAAASTPMKAKNIGRKLRLRKDWDNIKYDVMKKARVYCNGHKICIDNGAFYTYATVVYDLDEEKAIPVFSNKYFGGNDEQD